MLCSGHGNGSGADQLLLSTSITKDYGFLFLASCTEKCLRATTLLHTINFQFDIISLFIIQSLKFNAIEEFKVFNLRLFFFFGMKNSKLK